MNVSDSYMELVNRGYSRAWNEGAQPYPALCYEIFLLDHARHKARQKELALLDAFQQRYDWQLTRRQRQGYLTSLQRGATLVLTDSAKQITWASQSFLSMTGYTPTEVLGQRPWLLQGRNTDPRTIAYIRKQLNRPQSVKADLINYRKNGEQYLCRLTIDPLHNSSGDLTHFIAVEFAVEG
ncbi:hypothetical protein GCM10023187_01590 [Nibrella viscosa]|uniref:PAS domain-containing protein n=1 Tax=Nibrella viscosa TaxID=1084524 RepID=A0ABP8JRS2_9BACT